MQAYLIFGAGAGAFGSKLNIGGATIVHGDNCPRDSSPSRQFSKETVLQGDYCPRMTLSKDTIVQIYFFPRRQLH